MRGPTEPEAVVLFNVDSTTGFLTLNNTINAGYYVRYFSGVIRTIAAIPVPSTTVAQLFCFNPDGVYENGSVLKCSAAPLLATGGVTNLDTFYNNGASLSGLSIRSGVTPATSPAYFLDVGMFWGNDCALAQ